MLLGRSGLPLIFANPGSSIDPPDMLRDPSGGSLRRANGHLPSVEEAR